MGNVECGSFLLIAAINNVKKPLLCTTSTYYANMLFVGKKAQSHSRSSIQSHFHIKGSAYG
jgi:hypothetical protein